jgi:hypothetical protein
MAFGNTELSTRTRPPSIHILTTPHSNGVAAPTSEPSLRAHVDQHQEWSMCSTTTRGATWTGAWGWGPLCDREFPLLVDLHWQHPAQLTSGASLSCRYLCSTARGHSCTSRARCSTYACVNADSNPPARVVVALHCVRDCTCMAFLCTSHDDLRCSWLLFMRRPQDSHRLRPTSAFIPSQSYYATRCELQGC